MADAEDIYDVAPTSTATVKDFSKLIGRFDQKQRPNSVIRPVKPAVGLKPVQLPPKKSAVSPGPLSPGAIVSPNLVNNARRQLSVVPNKRESCVRVSEYNPPAPQQSGGAPPVIPSKKKAAPPPIAEVPEAVGSPPPQNGTTSIEHRPPPAVPVESARPNSVRVSKLDTTGTPKYDNNTDKMKRVSSKGSATYADVKHYKQLPVPVVNDPPPPKPSRPPNVELPDIDDIVASDDIYDDVRCQPSDSRQSMIPEMLEDEDEAAEPPLPRRLSKEKADQRSRSVKKPPPAEAAQGGEDVYEEVQMDK